MKYTSVRFPEWSSKDNSSITALVTFEGIGEVPFSACPDDCTEYGKEIYAKALAGEFGEIAPYEEPPKSPEQIQSELMDAIQKHLDTTARARGYDSILSLCSYATSTNAVFAAEGQAGVAWRDVVWEYGGLVLEEVKQGMREIPTAEELVSSIPPIQWPN